jgi:hypothetical protein
VIFEALLNGYDTHKVSLNVTFQFGNIGYCIHFKRITEVIFTFRYIDYNLPINKLNFSNKISIIYHKELEIKKTSSSASYHDNYLKVDTNGQLFTTTYDKRNDFSIIQFPHLDSNITTAQAYGVHISHFAPCELSILQQNLMIPRF